MNYSLIWMACNSKKGIISPVGERAVSVGSLLDCYNGWIYFFGCFNMQTIPCKENYFFNLGVKPFVEQLQSIFAGEADVWEPLREWIYYRFVVDIYFKSFAAYFTALVYAECTGSGSDSDGSNFLVIFSLPFSLSLTDDTLLMRLEAAL